MFIFLSLVSNVRSPQSICIATDLHVDNHRPTHPGGERCSSRGAGKSDQSGTEHGCRVGWAEAEWGAGRPTGHLRVTFLGRHALRVIPRVTSPFASPHPALPCLTLPCLSHVRRGFHRNLKKELKFSCLSRVGGCKSSAHSPDHLSLLVGSLASD